MMLSRLISLKPAEPVIKKTGRSRTAERKENAEVESPNMSSTFIFEAM
jgi:hypothetical protein